MVFAADSVIAMEALPRRADMEVFMIRTSLIALMLLGGCATAQNQAAEADRRAKAEIQIADALKGLTPGEPKSCIDQTRVHNVRKFAGPHIHEQKREERREGKKG